MSVLDAFGQALSTFGNAGMLLAVIGGILVGVLVGVIPGINGLTAISMLLPFTFHMKPETALPLIIAIQTVQFTGGAITTILLNMPGEEVNAATLMDGFPMTQKGQAGRALGAAFASAAMGNIVTVVVSLALISLIVPLLFSIRTADMVFVVLLGLLCIAALGQGSMTKGLISGGLGLLIATIGTDPMRAIPRFTFGSTYLYEGIGLLPLVLGLFAIPEMIALAASGGTIARTGVVIKGMRDVWEGARDVLRHWTVWLRSCVIGYIVGILPGIGSTSATFVAYGQAKATSKHPEKYGTGTVEGVIAPESASHASLAGDLTTTLALGIPGSSGMIFVLAAMWMVGLVPGPDMLTKHLPLSLSLLLVIFVAGIIGAGICFLVAPSLARIAFIPGSVLAPLVLVLVFVGVFTYHQDFTDIVATLICGVVGLVMKRFGYSRPAMLLGWVLGGIQEQYLFLALKLDGPLFFMRPISLSLILIIVLIFAYGPVKKLFGRRRGLTRA